MSVPLAGPACAARGGSWVVGARDARAAYRFARDPSFRDHRLGLRLVRRAS